MIDPDKIVDDVYELISKALESANARIKELEGLSIIYQDALQITMNRLSENSHAETYGNKKAIKEASEALAQIKGEL